MEVALMNALTRAVLAALILLCIGCSDQQDDVSKVHDLADRYLMFWNTGIFDGIDDVTTDDFSLRMSPSFGEKRGRENFRNEVLRLRTMYPDFDVHVDEMIYADSTIALRWTITATHTGQGQIPPTGKPIDVTGMSILHLKNGKIADEWISANDYEWYKQLGFSLTRETPEAESEE
jgi:steroid delta-isomerase-like uncharacterized protein